MDIAEMQQRLKQSLADRRVVQPDADTISIALVITNVALGVTDQPLDPCAIVAKNVWFLAKHGSASGFDKGMLMRHADTVAEDYRNIAPIAPDALLRTKIAISCAFDEAFPGRNPGLGREAVSYPPQP